MTTFLVEMDPAACARRLREARIGRLGVVIDGHPEIFPVNHVFDPETGAIFFPTSRGTKLDAALRWPSVAFEVDGMDDRGGWSVLALGPAEVVEDRDTISRLQRARDIAWVSGDGFEWVRIAPTSMSGRRIQASDHGVILRLGLPAGGG